jgi:hypothetical protein
MSPTHDARPVRPGIDAFDRVLHVVQRRRTGVLEEQLAPPHDEPVPDIISWLHATGACM